MFNLESKIEALLYWKGEPMDIKEISKALNSSPEDIQQATTVLEEKLKGRGLVLIKNGNEIALGTAPEMSESIENILKEEMSKDLGRAGLETLSIILYYGPISRRDIEYIRGVNSTFIIKSLLIRGLVEKQQDKKDLRTFLYEPTMELLRFLGVSKVENLPEYAKTRAELQEIKEKVEIEFSKNIDEKENPLKENEDGKQ